ncbi:MULTISPECIES: hypothetical protein [Aerosakkonema]|uniref:hypothetical protein n=1 Tax=Aerosakkonema TaxID=1246629 RepID=UPI0035B70C0A
MQINSFASAFHTRLGWADNEAIDFCRDFPMRFALIIKMRSHLGMQVRSRSDA